MKKTTIQGRIFKVDDDLNLITPEKTVPKDDMQFIADHYRGMNRIHKPMALLFWQDVKNGKSSNWKII